MPPRKRGFSSAPAAAGDFVSLHSSEIQHPVGLRVDGSLYVPLMEVVHLFTDIPFPPVREFEVQAEAYFILKNAGYNVRGEVKVTGSRREGVRGARFDLVIFNWERRPRAILLLETKRQEDGQTRKQGDYYERLTGLQCLYVRGLKDCNPELVTRVKEALGTKQWSEVAA